VLGYFESSPPFFTPGDAQVSKANDPRARVLTLQVNNPSSPIGPWPVLLGCISGHVARKPSASTCHSRCHRYVDGRAQHSRWVLLQYCKHAENPVLSSLPACRDTTCTEPRVEVCMTITCTNFGLQNMGRKPNVCPRNNWSVPIEVLTSVNNAPWCVVRKPLLYPPIELHGHRGCAWRVIKCVPLVTDFMGRVYMRQAGNPLTCPLYPSTKNLYSTVPVQYRIVVYCLKKQNLRWRHLGKDLPAGTEISTAICSANEIVPDSQQWIA
jgi:hypothetical protein